MISFLQMEQLSKPPILDLTLLNKDIIISNSGHRACFCMVQAL